MRWKWYHAKKRNFEGEDHDFEKKPWYQHSEYNPPPASPTFKAFMEKVLTDLMNPTLRRKIKDNFSAEEREDLKDFKQNFPANNLRVRKEDKGPRFVIADGATEDEMIENDLKIW